MRAPLGAAWKGSKEIEGGRAVLGTPGKKVKGPVHPNAEWYCTEFEEWRLPKAYPQTPRTQVTNARFSEKGPHLSL